MERESRYWFVGLVGKRENILFKKGMEQLWDWAKPAEFIRVFTDGEYCYSDYLWPLAYAFLKSDKVSGSYRHRKVWRQGLEVACKVKGFQGTPRRVGAILSPSLHSLIVPFLSMKCSLVVGLMLYPLN
jgi:hypothetical protein